MPRKGRASGALLPQSARLFAGAGGVHWRAAGTHTTIDAGPGPPCRIAAPPCQPRGSSRASPALSGPRTRIDPRQCSSLLLGPDLARKLQARKVDAMPTHVKTLRSRGRGAPSAAAAHTRAHTRASGGEGDPRRGVDQKDERTNERTHARTRPAHARSRTPPPGTARRAVEGALCPAPLRAPLPRRPRPRQIGRAHV